VQTPLRRRRKPASQDALDAKRIGKLIRQWRRRKGWTQADLTLEVSEIAGGENIYRQLISLFETGKRQPTLTQLQAIGSALNLPISVWFDQPVKMQRPG
jgi:transcriptional regulator with XRE-family HTH domain